MLELRNITKRFGSVLANDNINIKVEKGTIHAIVGENGAGKSTIMRIAYGFYNADSGEILIDGQARDIKTPHDAIAQGVGMVHQHFMLVDTMTVAENIVLGAEPGSDFNLDLSIAASKIKELSSEFKLHIDPNALIENLSVGQQQRVELLKALYREARLLILDEPTAVLTPQEVEEFFTILKRMREQGKTIIIITHKLAEVLAISDNVTVMRDGKVVGNVKTSETNKAELARMMVGREVLLRVEKPDARVGSPVLKVENLRIAQHEGTHSLKGVSFEVKAGEIVGIAGVEGNGQTELIEALAGLQDLNEGEILFKGKPIVSWRYSTAKSLRFLLLFLFLVYVLSDLIVVLNSLSQATVLTFLIPRLVVWGAIVFTLIKGLLNRKIWACYGVIVISSIGLLGLLIPFVLLGLSIFRTFLSINGFLLIFLFLKAILLIYAIKLAVQTIKEFNLNRKTEFEALNPRKRKELGIAHIPEDRHKRGLVLDFDLAENSILGVHYRPPAVAVANIVLDEGAIQRRANQIIKDFDVRPPNAALAAKSLSGGNQQKLIIGREFDLKPKLLLVSQPTRGVDIGAIEFIHRKLVELRDAGCAVLLVSAELEEVTALADRLLVIHEGEIVGEVDPKVATTAEIGLMMTGGKS